MNFYLLNLPHLETRK